MKEESWSERRMLMMMNKVIKEERKKEREGKILKKIYQLR